MLAPLNDIHPGGGWVAEAQKPRNPPGTPASPNIDPSMEFISDIDTATINESLVLLLG